MDAQCNKIYFFDRLIAFLFIGEVARLYIFDVMTYRIGNYRPQIGILP